MRATWWGCLAVVIAGSVAIHGQRTEPWHGVLDEHPVIQYATRPTTDRIAALRLALSHGSRTLTRDAATGYLRPVLDALGIAAESQLLVFSKTGVQRAFTGPKNPRALYFDQSVVVAYVPGAPLLEMAAHDPQQGVVFYTIDQDAKTPVLTRQQSCVTCHVAASTLDVPGLIARSHTVDADGNILPQSETHAVDHATRHPDRWGGWFVTSEDAPPPYSQLAHLGNITFSGNGETSNQVFVEWMNSAPETRGYLSAASDIAGLLVFDHQAHAINLLTKLNWESRVAAADADAAANADVRRLVDELAEYLLFAGEEPPSAPLTPRPGFAASLLARTPADHRGRSFAQFDLDTRLLRYPCSFMIYSDAFSALPPDVKASVYRRMIDTLSGNDARARRLRTNADDRRAILEILRETKPDFPRP